MSLLFNKSPVVTLQKVLEYLSKEALIYSLKSLGIGAHCTVQMSLVLYEKIV